MNVQRQGYEPMYCGKTYLARIVGIIKCGKQHYNLPKWVCENPIARPECVIAFEFLDQDLNVSNKMPLTFFKSMAHSFNPKSRLTALADNANREIPRRGFVYEVGGEFQRGSKFELEELLYSMYEVRVRESTKHKGCFMITDIYKANDAANVVYREATLTTPYIYDIPSQEFTHGFVKDFENLGMIKYFTEREER